MSTVAERLTADDYLARDDPRRTELIDGVLVVNEPSILHQHVCGLVYQALAAWTRAATGRGMATLPLNVAARRRERARSRRHVVRRRAAADAVSAPRVPDLVVEVRSPATWRFDVGRKRDLYERHGVRELWLVDPFSRSVLAFRRPKPDAAFDTPVELLADDTISSPLLPGFTAVVGELVPAARVSRAGTRGVTGLSRGAHAAAPGGLPVTALDSGSARLRATPGSHRRRRGAPCAARRAPRQDGAPLDGGRYAASKRPARPSPWAGCCARR